VTNRKTACGIFPTVFRRTSDFGGGFGKSVSYFPSATAGILSKSFFGGSSRNHSTGTLDTSRVFQPITGYQQSLSTNQRILAESFNQSQAISRVFQPIIGHHQSLSANHRIPAESFNKSQDTSRVFQPITGYQQSLLTNPRIPAESVNQSDDTSRVFQPFK
jgi:hypothetical protein